MTPTAIGQALEQFVLRSTNSLPDDLGDGPWHDGLAVAFDPEEVVAGLLWCRLGAPDARNRWRAAHAIRRIVSLGRTNVMHAVIAWLKHPDAGAFQDRKLSFFQMHAKLWLLFFYHCAIHPKFKKLNSEMQEMGRVRIEALIRAGLESGAFKCEDPALAAKNLQAVINGYLVLALTEDSFVSRERLYDEARKMASGILS